MCMYPSVYRGVNYSSSIPFEMWCRFYHPNTRDQMMAKSYLPLSKLLALITMNGSEETVSCQSYSLPLMSSTQVNKVCMASGLLSVYIICLAHTVKFGTLDRLSNCAYNQLTLTITYPYRHVAEP